MCVAHIVMSTVGYDGTDDEFNKALHFRLTPRGLNQEYERKHFLRDSVKVNIFWI